MLELLVLGVLSAGSVTQMPDSKQPVHHSGHYDRLFVVAPVTAPGVPQPKQEPTHSSRDGHEAVPRHHQRHDVERGPCKMPIVVGDASADPGILIKKKHSNELKIRVVQPPACGPK